MQNSVIEEYLKTRGMSIYAFANELNIPYYTVWRWVKKKAKISKAYQQLLAIHFLKNT